MSEELKTFLKRLIAAAASPFGTAPPGVHMFQCACMSPAHILHINTDPDDPEIIVSIHLAKLSLFMRLLIGVRYICGFKTGYWGTFEDIVLPLSETKRLHDLLCEHLKAHEGDTPNEEAIPQDGENYQNAFNRWVKANAEELLTDWTPPSDEKGN